MKTYLIVTGNTSSIHDLMNSFTIDPPSLVAARSTFMCWLWIPTAADLSTVRAHPDWIGSVIVG